MQIHANFAATRSSAPLPLRGVPLLPARGFPISALPRHLPSHGPARTSRQVQTPGATGTTSAGTSPAETQARANRTVVVGAGPTGLFMALKLAEKGFAVDVYDARGSPLSDKTTVISAYDGKQHEASWVVLTARGVEALKKAGLAVPTSDPEWVPITESNVSVGATSLSFPLAGKDGAAVVAVRRLALGRLLTRAAQDRYADRIRLFFNHRLEYITVDKRRAVFLADSVTDMASVAHDPRAPNKEVVKVDYPLLIGADGESSTVRHCLEDQAPSFSCQAPDPSIRHVGTTLVVEGDTWSRRLSLWIDSNDGQVIIAAQPNGPGSVSVSITYPKGLPEKFGRLLRIKEELPGWEAYLAKFVPSLPADWRVHVAKRLVEDAHSKAKGGEDRKKRCYDAFHGPGVALVGEAAHALGPMLAGHGLSLALESCEVLQGALSGVDPASPTKVDLDHALDRFTSVRRDDVAAAVHMSDKLRLGKAPAAAAKPAGGDKAKGKGGPWANVALRVAPWALALLLFVNRVLPFAVRPPTLLQLQTSGISFSSAVRLMAAEQERAVAVLAALLFVVALLVKVIVQKLIGA